MKAIYLKELYAFFGSLIGYLVIGVFLILSGLFLFVFDGEFNLLNAGYADLQTFFNLTPWIMLFLIPALTMKSFADEQKTGTIELLLTMPFKDYQITLGKFFSALTLVVIALLPTIIYVYIINQYSLFENPVDFGVIYGSYFGLIFLVSAYISIGLFCSALNSNQIVAFILTILVCFFIFYGFEALSSFESLQWLSFLSMKSHYDSINKGVIDTRDLVYFLSISALFLVATTWRLNHLITKA
jgi:ABC-2 type transport system permease protein